MKPKKPKDRPTKYSMPERIDAAPERLAEVVLGVKPKNHWDYEAATGRTRTRQSG